MREDVADRVFRELTADGYDPKLHPPHEESGPFEIRLRGQDFNLGEFKTHVKISDLGLGMTLDSNGWIKLSARD